MAWLDCISFLAQLFPDELGPFSIDDGVQALREAYPELNVTYARVFHSYWNLYSNQHTCAVVKPLNEGCRPLLFSAPAMRRIARKLVKSKLPAKIQVAQPRSKANIKRRSKAKKPKLN